MDDILLNQLDLISQSNFDIEQADSALDLLEKAAIQYPLQALIQRYSTSQNLVIVRALSFVMAQTASKPTAETVPLVFVFLNNLDIHHMSDPSILINILTTIQRQLIYDFTWQPVTSPPASLYPFLIHTLNKTSIVQSTACAVLTRMYEDGILTIAFSKEQQAEIRQKLIALTNLHIDLIDMELEGLEKFIES